MKTQLRITLIFMLVALFAINIYSAYSTATLVNTNPSISNNTVYSSIILVESNEVFTQNLNFTVFETTYTAVVVTNSELTNLVMSENGLGIKFQATAPAGTTGYCNVMIPAILFGSDIVVFENGNLLARNADYMEEVNEANYIFHLTFGNGTHEYIIEAATANSSGSPDASSLSQNLFGMPVETAFIIVAVGVAAAISIAAAFYFIQHAAAAKAASAAGGAAGGDKGNTPSSSSGGDGSADVPVGKNVTVNPHPKVQLQFSQVNTAGIATANPTTTYPPPPDGIPFLGLVFDVKTTALFTGIVLVGLLFDKDMDEEKKKKLKVYRYDPEKGGVWEDVTSSIDAKNNIAYGATDHFSIFGVR